MKHLGIFIEPVSELKQFILEAKNFISKFNKDCTYENHPPHMTLLHGKYKNESKVLNALNQVLSEIDEIFINCKNLNSFKNDQLTGLNTLYVEVEPNENLNILQNEIIKNIKPDEHSFVNLSNSNSKIIENLNVYRYPFIYPDWIPHFTIASVDQNIENKFNNTFKEKFEFTNKIEKVSLWEISGDKHDKIKDLKVGT